MPRVKKDKQASRNLLLALINNEKAVMELSGKELYALSRDELGGIRLMEVEIKIDFNTLKYQLDKAEIPDLKVMTTVQAFVADKVNEYRTYYNKSVELQKSEEKRIGRKILTAQAAA